MRLLAERIAGEEQRGGLARALDVTGGQARVGDGREGVLVQIRDALAVGREALVAEALGEVAAIERERPAGILGTVRNERLEGHDVEVEPHLATQAQRVLADLEEPLRVDAGRGEPRPDEPQRLAKRRCRGSVEVRPEVGRDRVAEPWPGAEGEEGEERLGVPAGESDSAAAGIDLEATEEVDCQLRRGGGRGFVHFVPLSRPDDRPFPPWAGRPRRRSIEVPPGPRSPPGFPPARPQACPGSPCPHSWAPRWGNDRRASARLASAGTTRSMSAS